MGDMVLQSQESAVADIKRKEANGVVIIFILFIYFFHFLALYIVFFLFFYYFYFFFKDEMPASKNFDF